jgi:hypothetical protein
LGCETRDSHARSNCEGWRARSAICQEASGLNGEVVPVSPPAPGHTAYSSMVEHEHDMVGLIAYSLYKGDKIAFMAKHFDASGRMPNDEEKMAFYRTSTLPGPVAAYRARATYLMQQMYDDLLSVQTTEIEDRYKAELVDELKKKHPFWESVWEHVVASLVVIAIGGLIALIFTAKHIGLKQTFSNIFDLPAAEQPAHSGSAPR